MGLILSGSPFSVHDNKAPSIDLNDYEGIPVLGICYGAQMVASKNGCTVLKSKIREYGRAKLTYIDHKNLIMEGVKIDSDVWMSHGDSINNNTDKLDVIASTDDVEVASYAIKELNFYGLQFHPEVTHSQEGKKVIENFALKICGCSQSWTPDLFIEQTVNDLRGKLGSDKVILGLSGGVDSSVAAFIINKAIGKNLFCVFVDNGLLRKNEFKQVLNSYKDLGLNVIGVDSKDLFYQDLKGKIDPEDKRKSIGKNFIKIFEEEAKKIGDISWLAQGTIYPDVIESISVKGLSLIHI